MPSVRIEPAGAHPVPFDLDEERESNLLDELAVTANTAELLEALGADITADEENLASEKRLLDRAVKEGKVTPLRGSLPAALGAAAFLRTYGQSLALDVVQVRSALTSKLLEIANCGDTKHELRAIELLGKHVDIGLFTERSEININYNTPEALEAAIRERVKRLLHADAIDLKPLGADLDEELAEFEDVEAEEDPDDG